MYDVPGSNPILSFFLLFSIFFLFEFLIFILWFELQANFPRKFLDRVRFPFRDVFFPSTNSVVWMKDFFMFLLNDS